jgi:hypothetical protein
LNPSSTAIMPSSRLQSSRSWILPAAKTSATAREAPCITGTTANAAHPAAAKATLASDTEFGRT